MKRQTHIIVLFLIFFFCIDFSRGANCSLRNPDREIYQMFSNADRYRSRVGKVDLRVRTEAEKMLGFNLTFSDLGKHTLYTVYEDDIPVGFVHSRSEVGKDGVVELVWAISIDMEIVGFKVQRCRSSSRIEIANSNFMESLQGKDYIEISKMLNFVSELGLSEKAQPLVNDIIKSAAKALVISNLAFGDIILGDRLVANVYRSFPGTSEIQQLETDSKDLTVLLSVGSNQQELGFLVYYSKTEGEYWWVIDNSGNVQHGRCIGLDQNSIDDTFREIRERLSAAMSGIVLRPQ